MTRFSEVAAGVHVLRHPVCDVNVTLVTGDSGAMIVDTLSTAAQARRLLAMIRSITALPLSVVNTHHHFDHCFGNATIAAPAWAHPATIAALRDHGQQLRQQWYDEWLPRDPELAAGLASVTIRPPEHPVASTEILDLGGRHVVVRYLGPGHTAGDLVVAVPDASVLVAGDLVESSGPPQFEDGYPEDWSRTLATLTDELADDTVVVPGHGAPVDRGFVAAQRDDLAVLARIIQEGYASGRPLATIAEHLTAATPSAGEATALDPATAQVAACRGLALLTRQSI